MSKKNIKILLVFCFVVVGAILMINNSAFASGAGLPWETPLATIQKSVTGPVAMVVSILAIVAVGITLIFGGDMQGFVRQLLYVTLVIGLIIMANKVITILYTDANSALITITSVLNQNFYV